MSKIIGSVVIPVYNQYDSANKVLFGFSNQNINMDEYEIIVVDDGSNDPLAEECSSGLQKKYGLNVEIIHQKNMGRAAARNMGVKHSQSNIIIFCDGDRMPHESFINEHKKHHNQNDSVTIGHSYDYFGPQSKLSKDNLDWTFVFKMSRVPAFYQKIMHLCGNEINNSVYSWLSFLAGNSSINKSEFNDVGGFDENIRDWGFEHFELGYRLYKNGSEFVINPNACSFHIPHKRENDFYFTHLKNSIDFIGSKHPELDVSFLKEFFGVSI